MKAIILALALSFELSAATTIVRQTYFDLSGKLASGTATIEALQSFTAVDGVYVAAQKKTITFTNGAFQVALEPNAGSSPSSFYVLTVTIAGGAPSVQNITVPASTTPVTVASIISGQPPITPQTVPLGQLAPGNASNGQVPTFNAADNQYEPASPAPGGVSSFNTRSGAITLLNTDIPVGVGAVKIANGSVSSTQYQYLSGVTSSLQTQLNSKVNLGTVVYADSNCATTGTYDDSCLTNALALLPSTGGVVRLGERAYTINNTVTMNKIGTFLSGIEGASTLKLANAANKDVLLLSTCHNCFLNGVTIDGNKANQTTAGHLVNVTNSAQVTIMNSHLTNGFDYGVWVANTIAFDITNWDYTQGGTVTLAFNLIDFMASSAVVTDASSTANISLKLVGNNFDRNCVSTSVNGAIISLKSFFGDIQATFNSFGNAAFNTLFLFNIDSTSPTGFVFGNTNAFSNGTTKIFTLTNGASNSNIATKVPTVFNSTYYNKSAGCNGSTAFQILNTTDAATLTCNNTSGVYSQGAIQMPLNGYFVQTEEIVLPTLQTGTLSSTLANGFTLSAMFYLDNAGSQSGVVGSYLKVDYTCAVPFFNGNAVAMASWTNISTTTQVAASVTTTTNKVLQVQLGNLASFASACNGLSTTTGIIFRVQRITYTGGSTNYTGNVWLLGFLTQITTML